MQTPIVEIAIPACNEERTIAATISSFRAQDYGAAIRIRVCANGCTDRTVSVVQRLQEDDPHLLLDVTPERGKPAAWNRLLAASTAQYLCFADADVLVPPRTISRLMEHLMKNSALTATGARVVPITADTTWWQNIAAPPAGPIHGLHGRLYLCRKNALKARLNACGFSRMPAHVIHEDRWITYVIGSHRWEEAPGAIVMYTPPSWADLPRIYRRHARGMRQIREEWPALHAREKPGPGDYVRWRAAGFLDPAYSHIGYGEKILGYLIRRIVAAIALAQVATENRRHGLEGWETAPSTKRLPDSSY